MKRNFEIRNQLMHPKSNADLDIDKTKVEKSNNATDWFYKSVRVLFHTSVVVNH